MALFYNYPNPEDEKLSPAPPGGAGGAFGGLITWDPQAGKWVNNPTNTTGDPGGGGGGGNGGGVPLKWFGKLFGGGGSAPAAAGGGVGGGAAAAGTTGAAIGGGGTAWYANPQLWSGVIGAIGGIYDSKQQKEAAERAAKAASGPSSTSPWGPSTPNREFGLEEAMRLYQNWAAGQPGGQPAGGGSPGGGGGGGGGKAPTPALPNYGQQLADAMRGRALGGHPLYDPANATAQDLMGGQNALRDEAAERFRLFGQAGQNPYLDLAGAGFADYENPLLQQFIDRELGGVGGGDGLTSGANRGSRSFSVGGGGGGAAPSGEGPVGAAGILKRILESDPYGENPATQQLIDTASRRLREQFTETEIPGLISEWEGRGRFGGGLYGDAMAGASGRFSNSLGDMIGQLSWQGNQAAMDRYNQALGLGTQYDLEMANLAEQAAGRRASSGAASASLAAQQDQARKGMMLDAIRLFGDDQRFGLGGLMGAADMLNNQQQFGSEGLLRAADMFNSERLGALGLVPALSGLDMRDLGGAFGAQLDLDRLAEERAGRQQAGSIARGNLSLAQQLQRFNMGQAQQRFPFEQLARFGDITNLFSSGYGTSQGPAAQPYPTPGMMSGALSGAATGLGIYNQYFGGGQQPPPQQPPPYNYTGYTGGLHW